MARIFINYRRDDTQGVAGRLFDHLAAKYSRSELFMDVDAMRPGIDFAKQLDTQVSQCHVLLAVIGPHWLDAHDQAGHRRLDNDRDYVRVELASALKRDIAVIPILVDGAVMPSEDNLSEDLRPLARRHGLELRHTRFNADADAIMHALEAVVPRHRRLWMLIGGGIAVAALAAGVVVWPKLAPKFRPVAVVASNPAPANPSPAPIVVPAPQPPPPSDLPAGVKLGEVLNGIGLLGSVFRMTDIAADPLICQAACRADTRCAAWTYTQPGSGSARCSLKPVIPPQVADACCTSGIEREPPADMREPPPIPAGVTGALSGIELLGGTYRFIQGADATVDKCQAACRAEGQCLAWDYMRPGYSSSDAMCFLKSKSSNQVASPCCVAGFERQVAAATPAASPSPPPVVGPGAMLDTDLYGSSYRNFELAADKATLCQDVCKADNHCLGWTYVHAGWKGPNAHCWLKNPLPQPSPNPCCISGIERTEAK
jgi:hypothetical protein